MVVGCSSRGRAGAAEIGAFGHGDGIELVFGCLGHGWVMVLVVGVMM